MRIVVLAAILVVSTSTLARAQTTSPEATLLAYSSLSSTVTLPTTSVGVGIYFTVNAASKGAAGDVQVAEAADAFLRQNGLQLIEDLAVGTGPALTDLASAAFVSRDDLQLFGATLRRHRLELLEKASLAKLTPTRALDFMRRVGALVLADPRLARSYAAFQRANGAS